jgi:hypothetical protein
MSIVLNATSEFCRALGDIPTYGQAGNREEDKDELSLYIRMTVDRMTTKHVMTTSPKLEVENIID